MLFLSQFMFIVICFHYSNTKGYQKIISSWFYKTPQEDNFLQQHINSYQFSAISHKNQDIFSQKHMSNNLRTLHINLCNRKKKCIPLK